jgi:hypothetical protein
MTRTLRSWLAIELVALIAACSPSGSAGGPGGDASSLIRQADEFGRRGDRESALRTYLEAIRVDPGAEQLFRISRYGGDVTELRGNESDVEMQRNRSVAELQNQLLRSWLTKHPDEWDAVVKLANNLVFLERAGEAEGVITGYGAKHAGDAWPHAWMAKQHVGQKKYAAAVEDVRRTAAVKTAEFEALVSAGESAYQIGKNAPKKDRKLRLAAANAGETALRRAMKIASFWPQLQTLSAVLSQRANLERDGEVAAELRAEAEGLWEEAKTRRLEEAARRDRR